MDKEKKKKRKEGGRSRSRVKKESPKPPSEGDEASIKPQHAVHGTVKGPSAEDFDPDGAASALRKAFKGLGTDEKVIIDVISKHTNVQRQDIKHKYKTAYGRDLISDLEDELGGHFLDALLALMCPTHLYDAHCLRKAMAGTGTDERTLIEILCARSNSELELIKEGYWREFGRKLEEDLISETGSHFGRLLLSLVSGSKDESSSPDPKLADQDAAKLQAAGVKKLGTDEEVFNEIFASRSGEQMKLTVEAYRKRTGRELEADIRKEFSGDTRRGLLAIVKVGKNPVGYLAERMQESMKGAGTEDDALIRLIVSRSEDDRILTGFLRAVKCVQVDLDEIKEEYQRRYKKTLAKAVRDDCSGDYCRLLLSIIA